MLRYWMLDAMLGAGRGTECYGTECCGTGCWIQCWVLDAVWWAVVLRARVLDAGKL